MMVSLDMWQSFCGYVVVSLLISSGQSVDMWWSVHGYVVVSVWICGSQSVNTQWIFTALPTATGSACGLPGVGAGVHCVSAAGASEGVQLFHGPPRVSACEDLPQETRGVVTCLFVFSVCRCRGIFKFVVKCVREDARTHACTHARARARTNARTLTKALTLTL